MSRTRRYKEWMKEYFQIAHRLEQEQIKHRKHFWKLTASLVKEVCARLGKPKVEKMTYEEFEELCRKLGLLT